jgi:hypothetical protein
MSGVTTMKTLDQGHPHPKLEVPGLRFLSRAFVLGGEHSREEPFEQLVNFFIIGVEEFLENENPKYRPRIKGE